METVTSPPPPPFPLIVSNGFALTFHVYGPPAPPPPTTTTSTVVTPLGAVHAASSAVMMISQTPAEIVVLPVGHVAAEALGTPKSFGAATTMASAIAMTAPIDAKPLAQGRTWCQRFDCACITGNSLVGSWKDRGSEPCKSAARKKF